MNTRKLLAGLLALVLIITVVSPVALADDLPELQAEATTTWTIEEPELQDTEMIMLHEDAAASKDDEDGATMQYDAPMNSGSGLNAELQQLVNITDQIRTALLNGVNKIDLSGLKALGILSSCDQFSHIGYYCPYADGRNITVSAYYYSDGTYAYIKVKNALSAAETQAWVNAIDAKLSSLKKLMNNSTSTLAKAVALHDYLVASYHYDTTYSHYYPGLLLTEKTGVCQSYSYLFQYLMNSQGIECYTTTSDSMNHAWNILKIGSSYYHIDVTWDDPIGNADGAVQHNYFLLSDGTIQDSSHNHYGWNLTRYSCWDTSYENGDYSAEKSQPAAEATVYGLTSSSCYYESVSWAADNSIVANAGKETFAPDDSCTRAQAVTYIWRAAGKPKAPAGTANPFYDVSTSDYYYNAVLWAVSSGVTSGVSATSFGPDEICSRAQIITFINRWAGNATAVAASNPFKDVYTSDYFYNAVLWGVEQHVVYGVSATAFAPYDTCTCAQIVTFIYRYVTQ